MKISKLFGKIRHCKKKLDDIFSIYGQKEPGSDVIIDTTFTSHEAIANTNNQRDNDIQNFAKCVFFKDGKMITADSFITVGTILANLVEKLTNDISSIVFSGNNIVDTLSNDNIEKLGSIYAKHVETRFNDIHAINSKSVYTSIFDKSSGWYNKSKMNSVRSGINNLHNKYSEIVQRLQKIVNKLENYNIKLNSSESTENENLRKGIEFFNECLKLEIKAMQTFQKNCASISRCLVYADKQVIKAVHEEQIKRTKD